jgi:hypothetical protein
LGTTEPVAHPDAPTHAGLPAPGGNLRRGFVRLPDDYGAGLGRSGTLGASTSLSGWTPPTFTTWRRGGKSSRRWPTPSLANPTRGPEHEEALVRPLDARAQRMHLSMASPQSLMLRHPRLRSLRPDRATARVAEESWPAGAIPGTR